MKIKTDVKIFSFLVIIFFILGGIYLTLNALACKHLTCISLADNNKYKIKEVYEENKYIFRALYEKDKTLLRVEIRPNYSYEETKQAIQTQLARTKGLFEDASAPYPGEISDVIACGEMYKPVYSEKVQNGIQISYFSGFVNDRLVFGSCSNDQAVYHDTLAMFYCQNQKKFYQLEIIFPTKDYKTHTKEYNKILDSIACK